MVRCLRLYVADSSANAGLVGLNQSPTPDALADGFSDHMVGRIT